MTQTHTPEPWARDEDSEGNALVIEAQYGDVIATACATDGVEAPNNAAHIVACVNACAGINPEAVPELVAIIDIALSCWGFMVEDLRVSQDERAAAERMRVRARAALAKATG